MAWFDPSLSPPAAPVLAVPAVTQVRLGELQSGDSAR
jgi:hypothetical protein